MRTLRLSLVGTVTLALLGGLSLVAVAGPEASEDIVVEVLSDRGAISVEAIPEDAERIGFARISIEPGVTGEVSSAQPHRWASLEYVQHGSLTFADNDRTVVWRAGGSTEDVPAGTTGSVGTGDLVLFYDGGAGRSITNVGPEAFVTYSMSVGDSRTPADPQVLPSGVDWRLLDSTDLPQDTIEAWFSAPIAVAFQRVTLEPLADLLIRPEDIPMWASMAVEDGRVRFGRVPASEAATADVSRLAVAGVGLRIETLGPGEVMVIRNPGDEPAVLIEVVLSPGEIGPLP